MLRIAFRYANQALFFPPPSEIATLGAAKENDFVVPIARTELSVPGDGLPVVTLPDSRLALARRLPRRPYDLVLAALLPVASDRPAGWKLDFFDYLAEKLRAL